MPKTGESLTNRQARMRTKGRQAEAQYEAASTSRFSEEVAYKKLKDRRRVLFGDK